MVSYDLRSLALMLSKAKEEDEIEFFKILLDGDKIAYEELSKLKDELKIEREALKKLNPKAISYTHFLSFLANYTSTGVQVMSLIVNLPVWSENCKRLLKAWKENYKLVNLGFLELFSKPYNDLEKLSLKIVERYLDRDRDKMVLCCKLIQNYELLFWDSIYKTSSL